MNVWVVFHWQRSPYDGQMMPCLVGIFDDPIKADEVCISEDHCVCPQEINVAHNGEPELHPSVYYPRCPWRTEWAQKAAVEEQSVKMARIIDTDGK